MSQQDRPVEVVEPDSGEALTLHQVCTILELRTEVVCQWVSEGIVRPSGGRLEDWRFPVRELERARRARRLQRDLELNTESLPLVLDLLGEVAHLRRRLRALEERFFE
jgi:chaperone modulatory protein CbpM